MAPCATQTVFESFKIDKTSVQAIRTIITICTICTSWTLRTNRTLRTFTARQPEYYNEPNQTDGKAQEQVFRHKTPFIVTSLFSGLVCY
jgi:hypothetical protein